MNRIDSALIAHYIAANTGIPTRFEDDENFTIPTNKAYAICKAFINDKTAFSLKHNDQTDGYIQFEFKSPAGDGSITAKRKADGIMAVFPIGQVLKRQGASITLTKSGRSPSIEESGWYTLIVRCFFIAVLPRN